jgi:hypothetical protein
MDREPSAEASASTGLRKRLQRMLAFGWAVTRHGWSLLATLLGSFVLTVPSWVNPLLSPAHAQKLTELLTASPRVYRYLAAGFFVSGLIYASFLAWNEERNEIERLVGRLAERPDGPYFTHSLAASIVAFGEHPDHSKVLLDLTIYNLGNMNQSAIY